MIILIIALLISSVLLMIISKQNNDLQNQIKRCRSVIGILSSEVEELRKTFDRKITDDSATITVAHEKVGKFEDYHKYEHYRLKAENAFLSRLLYDKAEDWDSEKKQFNKEEEEKNE